MTVRPYTAPGLCRRGELRVSSGGRSWTFWVAQCHHMAARRWPWSRAEARGRGDSRRRVRETGPRWLWTQQKGAVSQGLWSEHRVWKRLGWMLLWSLCKGTSPADTPQNPGTVYGEPLSRALPDPFTQAAVEPAEPPFILPNTCARRSAAVPASTCAPNPPAATVPRPSNPTALPQPLS